MEADWEVEIGGGAPVIEANWPGFVDLCRYPERVVEIAEAVQFPALARALVRMNAATSPAWTSKCDVWPVGESEFDPDELDAPPGHSRNAIACYIDLLPRSNQQWSNQQRSSQQWSSQQWTSPAIAAAACKHICIRIRSVPLRCCRLDLVIRRAFLTPGLEDLGVTAYLTACGSTTNEATAVLEKALAILATTLCAGSTLE